MASLNAFKRYRKYFKNYLHVTLYVILNKYPVTIIFRNGSSIVAKNAGFVHLASTGLKFQYKEKSDICSFNFNNINLNFHGVIFNNDLADTFGFETYAMLNVYEKIVVDIGANIGDTSIYFALKGAYKVVALEPSLFAFKYLKENVRENGFESKIICINEGVGSSDSSIKMEDNEQDVTGLKAIDQGKGITVPILTFKSLIKTEGIQHRSVLKMDCEGCEYDSLLSSDCDTIKIFEEIIMEYHDDPIPLVKKLIGCGYSINLNGNDIHEITKISINSKNKKIGYIYAKLLESHDK